MPLRKKSLFGSSSGQALLETALVMPLLLFLVLNAVNFGYCFIVALNLTAAPRSGVLYSIVGFDTPATLALPQAGPPTDSTTVSYLTFQDILGALPSSGNATVQVCSSTVGVASAGTSSCVTCVGSSANCNSGHSLATPDADPEAGVFNFILQRVDIKYSFTPLIPGGPFLLLLPNCSGSTCTFNRHVSMRMMN
jgi:hypothetical protein